jgi:hypothetical protein
MLQTPYFPSLLLISSFLKSRDRTSADDEWDILPICQTFSSIFWPTVFAAMDNGKTQCLIIAMGFGEWLLLSGLTLHCKKCSRLF